MAGRELLDELEAQEARLVFDRFDEATAWDLGVRLRDAEGLVHPFRLEQGKGHVQSDALNVVRALQGLGGHHPDLWKAFHQGSGCAHQHPRASDRAHQGVGSGTIFQRGSDQRRSRIVARPALQGPATRRPDDSLGHRAV